MDIHENFDPPGYGEDASDDISTPWHDVEPEPSKPIILKIAEINQAFEREIQTWHQHGIDPANMGINMFFLNSQVGSLTEYLTKLIPNFEPREYELKWKEDLVARLIEARLFVVAEKTKRDITSGIVDSNGNPINFPKS